MKPRQGIAALLLFPALLLFLYVFGVKKLEKLGLEAYHRLVVRNLVQDKQALIPQNSFLLGLYRPELPYQFNRLYTIQERLGARISIVSYYQAWGEGEEFDFNPEVNKNLGKGGFTPLITWEPWVAAFPGYKGRRVDSSLALLAGGAFDGYIRAWARQTVIYGKPIYLRPGHEMSNAWYSWSAQYGNTPDIYKNFWRHVHRIFQEEGARNAAFVWTPYTPQDTVYYPGEAYVDWIGLDIFNFGSLSQDGIWMDFYTVTKILYDAVKGYDKPILVAEVGCAASGGSKNNWFRDMFHSLAVGNFPLIKGLVLFDTPMAVTPTGIPADLGISSDSSVFSIIDTAEIIHQLNIKTYTKGDAMLKQSSVFKASDRIFFYQE